MKPSGLLQSKSGWCQDLISRLQFFLEWGVSLATPWQLEKLIRFEDGEGMESGIGGHPQSSSSSFLPRSEGPCLDPSPLHNQTQEDKPPSDASGYPAAAARLPENSLGFENHFLRMEGIPYIFLSTTIGSQKGPLRWARSQLLQNQRKSRLHKGRPEQNAGGVGSFTPVPRSSCVKQPPASRVLPSCVASTPLGGTVASSSAAPYWLSFLLKLVLHSLLPSPGGRASIL